MYGLLLALVLTQAPAVGRPSAVVLVERSGSSPESAQALAREVSGLLEKEGLPITATPREVDSCEGRRPCLMERARALGATVVVLLRARDLTGNLTLNLEAVALEDGSSLWKDLFLVTGGSAREQELREGIAPLAQTLRPELAPPEPATVAKAEPIPDTPLITPPVPAPPLEPSVEPPKPAAITFNPQAPAPTGKRSRTLLYATGAGTIAAVGATVTFGLMGLGQKSRLNEARFTEASTGRAASRFTQAEAEQVSGRSNLYLNVALSSAIVSAVLGTTTGYLWLKDGPSP